MDLFKKYKGFTIFYLLVIIANLLFFTILTEYRMVSKPLIMGSLIGFYIGTVTKQSPSFILAMIFALLGDIFLMIDGDDFFLLGLGSFLIMQIGYAFNFYQDRQHNSQKVTTITTVILPRRHWYNWLVMARSWQFENSSHHIYIGYLHHGDNSDQ
jgi:uncharacterized membrane protein YhhN